MQSHNVLLGLEHSGLIGEAGAAALSLDTPVDRLVGVVLARSRTHHAAIL